jgi:hypothetical protein
VPAAEPFGRLARDVGLLTWADRLFRQGLTRHVALGALLLCAAFGESAPAEAQDGDRSLSLIDVHQGSGFSDLVRFLSNGGYELAASIDGDDAPPFQSFGPWYQTYWRDFTMEWLLQLDETEGILFGLSTGEHGEKYSIQPAIQLGLIKQWHPRPNATLSLTLGTTLWGHLSEFPCTADYGDLGIYTVNCRLAADPLIEPQDTLKYLLNEDPSRLTVKLSYSVDF